MTAKILCIYHANCTDGFGAAWAVRSRLGDGAEFYAGSYGQEPPDVSGREVLLVDFSYKRATLEEMIERCETLTILDHHKTAQADLAGLNNVWPGVKIIFDMNRSGAGLAWDYFRPGEPRPWLIDLIEVRDLWRQDDFRWSPARLLHAYVNSFPFTFDEWQEHYRVTSSEEGQAMVLREGAAILRQHDKQVSEVVALTRRRVNIAGVDVPLACVPPWMASDAGHVLGENEPFGATYYDGPKGRAFSLRSRPTGADVSAIAAKFGGGGHEHAAGFMVPRDHELAHI